MTVSPPEVKRLSKQPGFFRNRARESPQATQPTCSSSRTAGAHPLQSASLSQMQEVKWLHTQGHPICMASVTYRFLEQPQQHRERPQPPQVLGRGALAWLPSSLSEERERKALCSVAGLRSWTQACFHVTTGSLNCLSFAPVLT